MGRPRKQLKKPGKKRRLKRLKRKPKKNRRQKKQPRKPKKEKEAKEAADKAKKEQEAKEAAEQAAAEKAKQDEEAARLRTLFEQIDLDGNGVLNLEEFQKAFKQAGGLGGLMASPAQTSEEVESSDSSKAKDKVR